MPLFSIVTICYNSSLTIERTIKSVLAQDFIDYEYIIVDGASTDETPEIVHKYEPLFEGRLKWKTEPDTGIYNAMNKGIARATGDIIGIVNSDDWLVPTALSSVAAMADKQSDITNMIFCGSMVFHYENGSELYYHANEKKFKDGSKSYSLNRGLFHPAMFVPKDIYARYGSFDENIKVSADVDFIFRCYDAGVHFYFDDVILSHMTDGGVSNKINLRKFYKDWYRFLTNRGKQGINLLFPLWGRFFILIVKKCTPMWFIKKYRAAKVK